MIDFQLLTSLTVAWPIHGSVLISIHIVDVIHIASLVSLPVMSDCRSIILTLSLLFMDVSTPMSVLMKASYLKPKHQHYVNFGCK